MTITTTTNERKMLDNLWHNDYGQEGAPSWSSCLECGPHGSFIDRAGFGGVVASLVKKDLAYAEGYGDEACTGITEAGIAYYLRERDLFGYLEIPRSEGS